MVFCQGLSQRWWLFPGDIASTEIGITNLDLRKSRSTVSISVVVLNH